MSETPQNASTCPNNILTNANNSDGVVISFTASANDDCEGSVPVICSPVSVSRFPVGTTTINAYAQDSSFNRAYCSFNVTVLDQNNFRITSVVAESNDVVLSWSMPQGFTGIVQAAADDGSGGYTNSFSDISARIFAPGSLFIITNYADAGAATNSTSRYYRVRLVP